VQTLANAGRVWVVKLLQRRLNSEAAASAREQGSRLDKLGGHWFEPITVHRKGPGNGASVLSVQRTFVTSVHHRATTPPASVVTCAAAAGENGDAPFWPVREPGAARTSSAQRWHLGCDQRCTSARRSTLRAQAQALFRDSGEGAACVDPGLGDLSCAYDCRSRHG
jgi:hypothetical protein